MTSYPRDLDWKEDDSEDEGEAVLQHSGDSEDSEYEETEDHGEREG